MKMKGLSEKEERLLMSYHDDACSWIASMRARRLLSSSDPAREYMAALQSVSSVIKSSFQSQSASVDLWATIDRRIDQEERAAVYLGERSFTERAQRSSAHRMLHGFSLPVAAAGALALVFLFLPAEQTTPGDPLRTSVRSVKEDAGGQGAIVPVAAKTSGAEAVGMAFAQNTPAPQFSEAQDPWEVEWIRSDGRVRMIQHRAGRAPILWINRQQTFQQLGSDEVHRLQDGSELRILDERVPQAITVSNE